MKTRQFFIQGNEFENIVCFLVVFLFQVSMCQMPILFPNNRVYSENSDFLVFITAVWDENIWILEYSSRSMYDTFN